MKLSYESASFSNYLKGYPSLKLFKDPAPFYNYLKNSSLNMEKMLISSSIAPAARKIRYRNHASSKEYLNSSTK